MVLSGLQRPGVDLQLLVVGCLLDFLIGNRAKRARHGCLRGQCASDVHHPSRDWLWVAADVVHIGRAQPESCQTIAKSSGAGRGQCNSDVQSLSWDSYGRYVPSERRALSIAPSFSHCCCRDWVERLATVRASQPCAKCSLERQKESLVALLTARTTLLEDQMSHMGGWRV